MSDICYPKKSALLSVEQALQQIRQAITAISDEESIALKDSLGRVLSNTILSPINIPPQRQAAMDGYAYHSSDIDSGQSFTLNCIGSSWAGQPYTGPMAPGQCIRIFTGAVVPDFADSVITQEQIQTQGEYIVFPANSQAYANIRAAGSDVKQHEVLISPPKKLTARDIGLLAAAGIRTITVKRKVRIGFFSTGDELCTSDQALNIGQIYDSNRYLLASLLEDPNHELTDLGIVKDLQSELEQTLTSAAQHFDVLLSSGGASVGEADFIKETLEKCGHVDFWKLAIKPGKPLTFGKIGHCWFFGLPGNPIAVLVTYLKFAKPGIEQLSGAPLTQPLQLLARSESVMKKSPGRQEYQRGILQQIAPGEYTVALAGRQDSHQLKVASLANCLIVLDRDCSGIEIGENVVVEPFHLSI